MTSSLRKAGSSSVSIHHTTMASADLKDELTCSICLTIYCDPVTLRCGHNFCRDCIARALDAQMDCEAYTCPQCRARFRERPVLQRNTTLCNIAEHFLSQEEREEVQNFPALWDEGSRDFANQTAKAASWKKVILSLYPHFESYPKELRSDIETSVKKRWRSVRERFPRAQQDAPSGSAAHGNLVKYDQELQFWMGSLPYRPQPLRAMPSSSSPAAVTGTPTGPPAIPGLVPTTTPPMPECNPTSVTMTRESQSPTSDSTLSSQATENLPDAEIRSAARPVLVNSRSPLSPPPTKRSKKIKPVAAEEEERVALQRLMAMIQQRTEDDVCSSFGRSLAGRLRNLNPDVIDSCMTFLSMVVTCYKDHPNNKPSLSTIASSLQNLWQPEPPSCTVPAAALRSMTSVPNATAGAHGSRVVAQSGDHFPDRCYYSYTHL